MEGKYGSERGGEKSVHMDKGKGGCSGDADRRKGTQGPCDTVICPLTDGVKVARPRMEVE